MDPTRMVQQIAEYAVWEHADRPWPDKSAGISVVPIISRSTSLLAVLWGEVDNRSEDMDIFSGSATQRVVFTLTAVSQSRKTVARMASHLYNAISFNTELIRRDAVDTGNVHYNEHEIEFRSVFIQDGIPLTDMGYPDVSEILTATVPQEFGTIRMDACYAESRRIWYDPTLDVWKSAVTFIADMYEIPENDDRFLREI